ncbi:MAG: hotdog fold thioesterase [Spirochaetes bacterium]|nr:MAG: hotdog fold thioesterase [Spirochaetota bacterium]
MSIWKSRDSIDDLTDKSKNTLVENIGIEYIEIGEDFIKAKMPVDNRTRQPYGILHGGASLAFAETLGSVAARLSIDNSKKRCVGLEINANHVRSVSEGFVYGIAKPLNLGNSIHVWEITITNDEGKLVCVSRMTLSILDKQ